MVSAELQSSSSRPLEQVDEKHRPKIDIDLVESAGAGQATTYEGALAAHLPKAHRDYLLERHGTLDLDPIPGMGPADPYNWPEWKVSNLYTGEMEGSPLSRRTWSNRSPRRKWRISFWWHSMLAWVRLPPPASFPPTPTLPRIWVSACKRPAT